MNRSQKIKEIAEREVALTTLTEAASIVKTYFVLKLAELDDQAIDSIYSDLIKPSKMEIH
jgi:hypothetical protein